MNLEKYEQHIYTDGSCDYHDKVGGWAVIKIVNGEKVTELFGKRENTTSNAMELEALFWAHKLVDQTKTTCFILDSKYAIGCYKKNWKIKKNVKIIKMLKQLQKRFNIDCIWVKGHSGNKWNEYVDSLANCARLSIDWNDED